MTALSIGRHNPPASRGCKAKALRLVSMPESGNTRRILIRGWIAWCAFVVYGSLLPFELRAVPWDRAVVEFAHLPWLNMGLGGRLDWLANALLYIPIGFVGTCTFLDEPRGHGASGSLHIAWASLAVFIAGSVLALVVEFTQIHFPPRTVSLNDVIAEVGGTAIGCVMAILFGRAFVRLLTRAASTDAPPRAALLQLYLLIYLGLSFFPFDFSTAAAVFERIATGGTGWWIAQTNAARPTREALQVLGEALLTVPFGLALGGAPRLLRWPIAGMLGIGLGIVIEVSQLFLLSATSQGASVLTRGVGFAVGAWLAPQAGAFRNTLTVERLRTARGCRGLALATRPCLPGRLGTQPCPRGWMVRTRCEPSLHTLLLSLLHERVECADEPASMRGQLRLGGHRRGFALGASAPPLHRGAAGLTATLFEASQLVLVGRHPDPTNVLIAAAAAWVAHLVFYKVREPGTGVRSPALSAARAASPARATAFETKRGPSAASAWPWLGAALIVGASQQRPATRWPRRWRQSLTQSVSGGTHFRRCSWCPWPSH